VLSVELGLFERFRASGDTLFWWLEACVASTAWPTKDLESLAWLAWFHGESSDGIPSFFLALACFG
jgi:hypothetical protein